MGSFSFGNNNTHNRAKRSFHTVLRRQRPYGILGTGNPGRLPRPSHSSRTLMRARCQQQRQGATGIWTDRQYIDRLEDGEQWEYRQTDRQAQTAYRQASRQTDIDREQREYRQRRIETGSIQTGRQTEIVINRVDRSLQKERQTYTSKCCSRKENNRARRILTRYRQSFPECLLTIM